MTKEEAKNELVLWRNRNSDNVYHYKFVEALTMAIKALEQQPCEDCISREQAIKQCRFGMTSLLIADCLRRLPSVTPQPKTGHWINLENTKYKGQVLPFWDRYECSRCGGHGEGTFNYCPNCGAKMKAKEAKADDSN